MLPDPKQLRDKTAIVGIGQTKLTRGDAPYTPAIHKSLEAARKAIEDAGLRPQDIDGVLMGGSHFGGFPDDFITNFGIKDLKFQGMPHGGGATAAYSVHDAVLAVATGVCKYVLVIMAINGYSDARVSRGRMTLESSTYYDYRTELERPYSYYAPMIYFGTWFTRHAYETGMTSRQLGAIAVACRKHACLNELALMRTPITIEDHQKSPKMTNVLRLLDCSIEADGGGAVVITSAERANDLKQRPVYIMGVGEGHPPVVSDNTINKPEFLSWGARNAANRAREMAGVTNKDMDFAEIYDAFTYIALFQLQEMGFAKKEEIGGWVEGGRLELGGELPLNTHGGLLSQGHVNGINHIVEGVIQLRGQAGAAQVKDAELGWVTGMGDMGCNGVIIMRRA